MAFQTMNLLLVPPGDGRGSRALALVASSGLKAQKEPLLSWLGSEEGLWPLQRGPLSCIAHWAVAGGTG